LLWVTEEVPDRDGGGGGIRQANLLIGVAEQFEICLLAAGTVTDAAVRAAVQEIVEVAPEPASPPSRLRTAWDLLVRRRGLNVAGSMPAVHALRPALLAHQPRPDLVVLNHENLLPLLPSLTRPRDALVVAHFFDLKSLGAQQAAAVAATRSQAVMWAADARVMRRLEVNALETVDVVVTCSQEDQGALRALTARAPRAAGLVVPNGVDLDRYTAGPAPRADRVLFFGSLDYVPNVDGVRWFAEHVWPLVLAERPGAALTVVGRRPGPEVRALAARPGIEVVADVPDAMPWYADSDVVVVPLRIGTGTRVKALEAMACGRPVVGTTVGLEGLRLDGIAEPGPARIADDGPGLAAAVVDLLRDPEAARQHGDAGRRHVEAHFSWAPIAATMAAELSAALRRAGVDR
jgi:glycosyltransferase involved in cell wall biosynthesis